MTTITMTSLVPRELIEPLKRLGQVEWLEIVPAGSHYDVTMTDAFEEVGREFPVLDLLFNGTAIRHDTGMMIYLAACSKLLADGPKLVRPTDELCESLLHVDLNLKISDYEQPFEVMAVEIPESMRKRLTLEFSKECPKHVILYHIRDRKFFAVVSNEADQIINFMVFPSQADEETMEEWWRNDAGANETEDAQIRQINRVAINVALLLVRYGHSDHGPVDPKSFDKQMKLSKSKSVPKRRRAQRLLDSSFHLISFRQEVKFNKNTAKGRSVGEPNGSKVAPHWRRGHIRRARVGTGRKCSRLRFIPPVFVNGHLFDGNKADTQYRIHTNLPKSHPSGELALPVNTSKPYRKSLKEQATCSDDPIGPFKEE